MKKFIHILTIFCLVITINACKSTKENENTQPTITSMADTSKTSLNWPGIYEGTVPCADCEGITTRIILNADKTYTMNTQYKGKSENVETYEGTFNWDKNGSKIVLHGMAKGGGSPNYLVGENVLYQLDFNGNRIAGNLANNYILKQIQSFR